MGSPIIEDIYPNERKNEILQYAGSIEKNSTHTIAKAINKKVEEEKIELLNIESFTNFPGLGLKSNEEQRILIGNKKLKEQEQLTINFNLMRKYLKFIDEGKTTIFIAIKDEPIGILTLTDKIKENSKKKQWKN